MLLTSSIVLGFFRLGFILLFFFYLNKKFINRSDSNNLLEFIVHHWFRYGSIIGLLLFVTVQLSIYNLVNCMIILLLIIIIDLVGLKNLRNFKSYFKDAANRNLHAILKTIELRRPKFSWLRLRKKEHTRSRGYFLFFLVIVLTVITFGSRYYFIKYDMYSLSGIWLADLEKVKDFDFQIWFLNDLTVAGDFAFVNFYSKLTDVSPEIALQSMALLESTLICILIFWVVRKCSPSRAIAPVIGAMSFALAYTLMPVNIYFLLQSKPILLALTFGLPAMVYLLKPAILKFKKVNYFFAMLFVFFTIGLIDLFTLYILFPPFVILAGIFSKRKSKGLYWLGASAYLAGTIGILGIYGVVCFFLESDLLSFIHTSLISVSSYSYNPQLIMPFDVLIDYYQIGSLGAMAVLLVYIYYLKENWYAAFAFLIYFNILVLIGKLDELTWIDKDLMSQALSVFMHVVAGISIAILLRLAKPISVWTEKLNVPAAFATVAILVYAAIFYQKDVIRNLDSIDTTPKQVLDAYDKISTTYFPFSYAVVNDNTSQAISTNKHFFMNYSDFIYEYPKQDSIYFANIKDPKFLKNNPEYALPKSVLIFVFNDAKRSTGNDNADISELLMEQLDTLRKRGRKVQVFYKNTNVSVYEVVNEPGESRIVDLIF